MGSVDPCRYRRTRLRCHVSLRTRLKHHVAGEPPVILTLFLALMALAVVVCFLGYFTGDEPYLTMGLFFLFLLSIIITTNNLEYQTGETKNVTFTYNATVLTSQSETTAFSYTPWNDNTSQKIGWGLGVITALGTALSLYNTKKRRMDGNG